MRRFKRFREEGVSAHSTERGTGKPRTLDDSLRNAENLLNPTPMALAPAVHGRVRGEVDGVDGGDIVHAKSLSGGGRGNGDCKEGWEGKRYVQMRVKAIAKECET